MCYNENINFKGEIIMFKTSDKIALAMCGAIVLTGLVVVNKGFKGLKELTKKNIKNEEKVIELTDYKVTKEA
jgi:hypothetical protein